METTLKTFPIVVSDFSIVVCLRFFKSIVSLLVRNTTVLRMMTETKSSQKIEMRLHTVRVRGTGSDVRVAENYVKGWICGMGRKC